jgi:hypothetical protein
MPTLPQPPCQITAQPITRKAAPIRPIAVHAFIDNLTVWVRQPLIRRHMAVVAPYHVEDGPAPFPGGYQQQLHVAQPSPEALRALSGMAHMLNYVEPSLDLIFDNEIACGEAFDFLDRHHVKRWHRGELRYVRGVTRYTDDRSASNNFVVYGDRPCKLTGELDCLHFDWRIRGQEACRRAGINSAMDVLHFDHRAFWEKFLILATVDLQKLGRLHRKYWKPRSAPRWISEPWSGLPYDKDLRTGVILFNLADRSTQKLLDRFGRMFRVRDCLEKLDVEHLLPACHYSDRPSQIPTTDPIQLSLLDIL